MKDNIAALLCEALQKVRQDELPDLAVPDQPVVERTKDPQHGDFATNVAMVLAKSARMAPRQLAEKIVAALPASSIVAKATIAGPGFINLTLAKGQAQELIAQILDAGQDYGRSQTGAGTRVIVEFVSANPTGPLHVGHGRHAAYGASVAALLEAVGYTVHKEYYVNDAGRQMDILASSVWVRYLQSFGEDVPFPANGYQGGYIEDIAADLRKRHDDAFVKDAATVLAHLPADEAAGGNKDTYIDALIANARAVLGTAPYRVVFDLALDTILGDIRDDLEGFGVHMDAYFSERSLTDDGTVTKALATLAQKGNTFEKDGAIWFRASAFGDDKDRVLVRANGQHTYVTPDIAYHLDKRLRGFGVLLDVLGSDHHGYVARIRAGLEAMGQPGDSLDVHLMQFVSLWRNGEKVAMTTRGGQFVTLRELREEVGNDAARFFYVMRSNDQHLDFDLDLAKSRREDNPVYYVQYAHARICQVLEQLASQALDWNPQQARDNLARLTQPKELALLKTLARYPELVAIAARDRAPHTVVNYLRDLAGDLHSFYNDRNCRVLVDDAVLRDARVGLLHATRQVLQNGTALLGVSTPERM